MFDTKGTARMMAKRVHPEAKVWATSVWNAKEVLKNIMATKEQVRLILACPPCPPFTPASIHMGRDERAELVTRTVDVFLRSGAQSMVCLLYTSPSPRDTDLSRMPSYA